MQHCFLKKNPLVKYITAVREANKLKKDILTSSFNLTERYKLKKDL